MDYSVITSSNIDQLKLLARWGKGRATHVEFSPDGKSILVTSYGGLYLFDAGNLDLQTKLTDEVVLKAEFLSNGTRIASLQESTIKIWDTTTGKQIASRELGEMPRTTVRSLSVSPLGDTVVLKDKDDKRIFIMNSELEVLDTLTLDRMMPAVDSWWPYCFDVSDDGSLVLLTETNSNAPFLIYTVASKDLVLRKQKHSYNVFNMALSPDMQFVVTTSGEGSHHQAVALTDNKLDVSSVDNLVSGAAGPGLDQNPIRFTADGKHIYFAYGWGKDEARVMNLEDNSSRDFSRPAGAVLAVSPDGKKVVVASANLDLRDLATDEVLASKSDFFSPGLTAGWNPTPSKMQLIENALVLLSADNLVRFISLPDGVILHSYPADSFSYSAAKNVLLIRKKGTITLLDPKTSTVLATTDLPELGNSGTWPEDVAISPDGMSVLAYDWKKQTVYMLDPNDLSIVKEISYSWYVGIPMLSFSPDGDYIIASGDKNSGLIMMKSTSAKFNRILSSDQEISEFVTFTQDSKKIIYTERPRWTSATILKWCEFEDGVPSCNSALDSDQFGAFGGCSLSPAGNLFIKFDSGAYSMKPLLKAWSTSDWSKVAEIEQVQRSDTLLAGFTPNGRFLINATDSGFIEVWGVKP